MVNEILRSKIVPPRLRHPLVTRARLNDRLNEGLGKRLILVAAPAGYGKSTLISAWVAELPRNVIAAWLTLEADDNEPAHFLTGVAAALRHAAPSLRAPLPVAPSDDADGAANNDSDATARLLHLLNRLAALDDNLVLVFDDYHVITAPAVHNLLLFLLNHLPETVTIVLVTRVDPPLPVARMRTHGQIVSLRAADLRFSPQEAGEFLDVVMGLSLSPLQVAALAGHTEGWVAGLQLAGLSLQQHQDVGSFLGEFAGDDHNIRSYLVDEVLTGQPAEVRRFLLVTSILEQMSAPLCAAVFFGREDKPSPEALLAMQQTLEYLEQHNLFVVPLDEHHEWYRYHALFAELLRLHLWHEHHDDLPRLHRHAARWLRRHGFVEEAHRQTLAAHRRAPVRSAGVPIAGQDTPGSNSWLTRIKRLSSRSLWLGKRSSAWLDSAHLFARGDYDSVAAPLETHGAHTRQQRTVKHTSSALHEPLSRREEEVLALLADGLSYQEIAQCLVISLPTVKTHIAHIYDKLDAHNRDQALHRAREYGLLPA
jgi:LuxR family maltose regulon positive regulatory protein